MALMIVAHPIPGFSGRVAVEEVGLNFIGGYAGPTNVPAEVQAQLTAAGFTLNASPSVGHPLAYVTRQELEDPASEPSVALRAAFDTPRVVKLWRQNGVNRTGATASDAALDAVIATATEAAPVIIELAPGDTYRFDAGHTFNPQAVAIRCLDGEATLDFRNAAPGVTGLTIARPTSRNEIARSPLAGVKLLGPTAADTTVDAIRLGGAGLYSNHLRFDSVSIDGFRDQWSMLENCYLNSWHHSIFRKQQRYIVNAPAVPNAHENQLWVQCVFGEGLGTSVFLAHQGATFHFMSCSFDYCERDFDIESGYVMLTDCYFEARDNVVTAATERVRLRPTNENGGPTFKMKGGSIWPFWSAAGTVKTFARITGDTSAIRTNAAVSLDGTVVRTTSTATARHLIIDDRIPYSGGLGGSNTDRYSLVNVRDLTYKDMGGSYGQYHPLAYKDVDGRDWQLDGGVDLGQVGDTRNTPMAWQHPTARLLEVVPRIMALQRVAPASGDLYVVALPKTQPGWRASAWEFLCALGAQGTSISYARMGLYDAGRNYETAASWGLMTSQAFTANTGSETIRTAAATGTLGLGHRNQHYYLALLITSTGTMPSLYGRKIDTATNPLLNPQGTEFGRRIVGKLTGQTALPATLDPATLVNVDFIPWLGIRPTTYA